MGRVAVAVLDFLNGPVGVFGNEGVGICGGRFQGGQVSWGAGVAEGDANIAEKGGAFDAFDRTFGEETAESGVVEGEEIAQTMLEDLGAGLEGGFAGKGRESVPRTGV